MALTSTSYCPAPAQASNVGFTSLGDIDRAGSAFCEAAHDIAIITEVQQYRTFRMRCLKTTLRIVDSANIPSRALVSVRLKRLDSIRRKINRPKSQFSLGRMDDVIGVRIICSDYQTVQDLSKRIQSLSDAYRLKDYTHKPHPVNTGYRSVHHIIRFEQPLSETKNISVRFEIQLRSFYQHQWAIWSELHGESIKVGSGPEEIQADLRDLSDRIARWEESNPRKMQQELPLYTGGQNIVVAWRQKYAEPMCYFFHNDVDNAVKWLNRLETKYPAERNDALLLVGVTTQGEAKKILRMTHPLYVANRIIEPEYWMPPDS